MRILRGNKDNKGSCVYDKEQKVDGTEGSRSRKQRHEILRKSIALISQYECIAELFQQSGAQSK